MSFFPKIDYWQIPYEVFVESYAEMSIDGASGNEGIALWLGDRGEDGFSAVTNVVILRGTIAKSPVNITIPPSLIHKVHTIARERGKVILGQIHSHGPGYGVDLSPTDRRYGFAIPQYLSLVAPDYAMRPFGFLNECGVHEYVVGVGYRRLTSAEATHRVQITDKSITVERAEE